MVIFDPFMLMRPISDFFYSSDVCHVEMHVARVSMRELLVFRFCLVVDEKYQ